MKEIPPIPIPFRVNFVMDSLKGWEAEAAAAEAPDVDAMPERIRPPVDAVWIAQSYMRLRKRGHDVRLTDKFVPEEVCVALAALKGSNRPYRSFAVSVQCHLLVARICEFNIVQNQLLLQRPNQALLPHWPQPGLIPRDVSRGTRLEHIGYFGDESLMSDFNSAAFRSELKKLGMTLVTHQQWNDYSNTDVVLAVRNVPQSYLAYKPASKLYNAWAAGCPALLGQEPAFAAHRRSNLDYIEVGNPAEALVALARLKAEPELFQNMVDNGIRRSCDFSVDAVARCWERLLSGPIADRLKLWRRGPRVWREARNLSRFVVRFGLHKRAMKNVESYNSRLVRTGHDWRRTEPVAV
jgi:hypothetical protein